VVAVLKMTSLSALKECSSLKNKMDFSASISLRFWIEGLILCGVYRVK